MCFRNSLVMAKNILKPFLVCWIQTYIWNINAFSTILTRYWWTLIDINFTALIKKSFLALTDVSRTFILANSPFPTRWKNTAFYWLFTEWTLKDHTQAHKKENINIDMKQNSLLKNTRVHGIFNRFSWYNSCIIEFIHCKYIT